MSDNKPVVVALVVVVLLLAGVFFYFSSDDTEVSSQAIEVPGPESRAPVIEKPEPEVVQQIELPDPEQEVPAFVLPRLDDSDQLIRDGIVSLTRHEGVNAWLSPNELIRKFVAFSDSVANGQLSKEPVRVLAPEGEFKVRKLSDTVYELDDTSYDRYNDFTQVVLSIDSRRAAEFYLLVGPMLVEAYSELGYPDKKFDDVVFQAIGRLLETPVITQPIRLVRPVVMYQFEDPRLESLSPIQKQMIRMGPKNTRALQIKLGEIALELRSIVERP